VRTADRLRLSQLTYPSTLVRPTSRVPSLATCGALPILTGSHFARPLDARPFAHGVC